MKAIETSYAGCRFRSRLEARWAVFFDTLGIEWEYEPQGYDLPSGPYLPDFLLPASGTWIEVKGHEAALNKPFLLEAGDHLPQGSVWNGKGELGPTLIVLGPIPEPQPSGDWGWLAPDSNFWGGGARWGFGTWHKNLRPWFLDNAQDVGEWLKPQLDPYSWNDAQSAYRAARSARFEHGETGRRVNLRPSDLIIRTQHVGKGR